MTTCSRYGGPEAAGRATAVPQPSSAARQPPWQLRSRQVPLDSTIRDTKCATPRHASPNPLGASFGGTAGSGQTSHRAARACRRQATGDRTLSAIHEPAAAIASSASGIIPT